MIPPGPPLSLPVAPEMSNTPARLPAAVGVDAPTTTDAVTKVSFFDEQKRRRRQTWRLSRLHSGSR